MESIVRLATCKIVPKALRERRYLREEGYREVASRVKDVGRSLERREYGMSINDL